MGLRMMAMDKEKEHQRNKPYGLTLGRKRRKHGILRDLHLHDDIKHIISASSASSPISLPTHFAPTRSISPRENPRR